MSCEQPLYTTIESVKVRLAGKVQFQQSDVLAQGELPDALLAQLISDAETRVEQELRGRYAIPFRPINTQNFKDLPDHTKRAIRRVVDMASVMEVLRTDFGRSGKLDSDAYAKNTSTAYDEAIILLMGQDVEAKARGDRHRFTPPLEGLKLAANNTEADDGFRGMLINTSDRGSQRVSDFAEHQLNDNSISLPTSPSGNGYGW
jgi:hypothetical protein